MPDNETKIVGEWLPYPETQPPPYSERLVLTEDGTAYLAELCSFDGRSVWCDVDRGRLEKVTHYAEINRLGRGSHA